MILIKLFLIFLKIGIFAIGGAYSFLPLLEREIVERFHWLTKEEFLDVLGIVKMLPGAISIKYATYTGYKIAGAWGIIAANLGNLVSPMILVMLAFGLYSRYKYLPRINNAFNLVQLAVFAMLVAVAFQLININQLTHPKSLLVIIIAFILFIYTKIHPGFIIMGAAIFGLLFGR